MYILFIEFNFIQRKVSVCSHGFCLLHAPSSSPEQALQSTNRLSRLANELSPDRIATQLLMRIYFLNFCLKFFNWSFINFN